MKLFYLKSNVRLKFVLLNGIVLFDRVFEVASGDLAGMGIVVISYTIKEISDDVGYLKVVIVHLHK